MITDGVLTLAPLRLADAATHLAGEDAELVRWLNGGAGTLPGVEAYIRSTIEQWAQGGPKLAFGMRVDGALAGTMNVSLALPEAKLAYGLSRVARCSFVPDTTVWPDRFAEVERAGVADSVAHLMITRSGATATDRRFQHGGAARLLRLTYLCLNPPCHTLELRRAVDRGWSR